MERPDYWKCPKCGMLNLMSHSKCQCGESKDSIRVYVKPTLWKRIDGGAVAAFLAIGTIIVLYACLTTIIADYCVKRRMGNPSQFDAYTYYNTGMDSYRFIIDIICYVGLPIILITWAIEENRENASFLKVIVSYVILSAISFLVMRFFTFPRLFIAMGVFIIFENLLRKIGPQEAETTTPSCYTPNDEDVDKEPDSDPYPGGTILAATIFLSEMASNISGHDDSINQVDEEPEDDGWIFGGTDDTDWSDDDE